MVLRKLSYINLVLCLNGMERRGFGHIEIVLAFILFISAIIFVTYFLITEKSAETSSAVLDGLKNKILSNLSTDIRVYSVYIKSSLDNQVFAIEVSTDENERVSVANLSGIIVPSTIDSDVVYVDGTGAGRAFQVTVGKDIEQSVLPTTRPELNTEEQIRVAQLYVREQHPQPPGSHISAYLKNRIQARQAERINILDSSKRISFLSLPTRLA